MQKVLTFGTFDGIHEGHRAMLKQAKRFALSASRLAYLIVAVAPDSVVKEIKGTLPQYSSGQRITMVKNERLADEVVLADATLNAWKIVKKYKPDIIAVGYDQNELKAALEEYFEDHERSRRVENIPKKPTIVVLEPHQPERYKSSLLNP